MSSGAVRWTSARYPLDIRPASAAPAREFPIEFPTKGWLQISHRISHLTKSPLDGPAAQLLLLGAGVGLGDALLALEHLGAGGEEEAGLGEGEAGRRKVRLII